MNKWIIVAGAAALFVTGAIALNAMLEPEPLVAATALATHEVGPSFYTVAVQPNADPATFADLAGMKCLDADNCMVGIWKQGSEPTAMPFTEAQIKAQAFAYTINRKTGFERMAWDCSVYPNTPRDRCLTK
ncbi:hypothetical protein [Brevundimonas sp. CEF1]|uniref:hypothetical protein n=1 Tax=Brevundimonas sp. CEF1 TaxID=3442642 RepID=UPI003F50DA49